MTLRRRFVLVVWSAGLVACAFGLVQVHGGVADAKAAAARAGGSPQAGSPAGRKVAKAGPLTIGIAAGAPPGAVIPPDFLGLSLETPALHLPAIESRSPVLSSLLSALGTGLLRISGDSVDRTQWLASPRPAAPWATATVTPEDLRNLAALMQASGWRLLLGLDLGHPEPSAVAEEAGAAASILGGSLAGVAIGNEPDLYTRPPAEPFRAMLGRTPLRPPGWGLAEYESEVAVVRQALATAAVSVPLYGPETASGNWLEPYAAKEGPGIVALTTHLYPLDRCRSERLVKPGPSIADLLNAAVAGSETQRIRQFVTVAARYKLPLRIDELGSVACGGQPGTSDTFAGALWALDAGLIAAREGVGGVNFTSGLGSCEAGGTIVSPWYSPLCTLPGGQVSARPEYYSLLLLHLLEGDAFLPVTLSGARDVAAFALSAPNGDLRVVIDDMEVPAATTPKDATTTPKDATTTPKSGGGKSGDAAGAPAPSPAPAPVRVTLYAGPSYLKARSLSLTAPGAGATEGVKLGGVALSAAGTLPRPRSAPLADSHGQVTLRVKPASAVLVTLLPAQ